MIFIQPIRKNDIIPEAGKQIELGRTFMNYHNWEAGKIDITLIYNSLTNSDVQFDKKIIQTTLKVRGNERGGDRIGVDCKEYSEGRGTGLGPWKRFFVEDLKITEVKGYFVLEDRTFDGKILNLYYIPEETSFKLFYEKFGNIINIAKDDDYDFIVFDDFDSRQIDNTLALQQIFYGAPGTGKSHEIKKQTIGEQIIRTTFHPDSDYSTFVGAYKPTTKQVPMRDVTGKVIQEDKEDVTEDRIIYEFVEQAFLQAYTQAWRLYADAADNEQPKKQFLVIEEINRGNCAQIFGDLFQLLDRNDAGFSEYPIKADKDMRKQLAKAFAGIAINDKSSINQWYDGKDIASEVLSGEVLLLPSNLFIWATMNTSDQSLFPIDSAFKRRWDWQYIPISNANKGWKIEVNGKKYDWWGFLEKMNEQINTTTNSEDKKMGYFFCKAKGGIIDAKTFVGKVVFYVWNDVFKDFANEAGGIFKDDDGTLLSFNKFYRVVNGKTEVVESKVEQLLKNLGVEAEGETIDIEVLEEQAPANSNKNYLKEIVFPDGTTFSTDNMSHFEAYIEAIRKIGVDRVASVAERLKYRRLNRPLISAEKYDEIENSTEFTYYQEGDYYFVKGAKTYTLVRILEDLNEMLNVGMTINC